MKEISSRDNPDYRRLLRSLSGKRSAEDRHAGIHDVALEGIHLCESWLSHMGQPELAFFDADRLSRPEIRRLLEATEPRHVRLCAPALMQSAGQVVHGQGVIFVARAPSPQAPSRISENCLWLDRVQDPGNMGTLLRTAAAAGMRRVYTSTGCVGAWTPKVLRSAQGAHFVINIHESQDLTVLADRLDVPLLATSLEDSQSLFEASLPQHAAWVFGNEGQGVMPELLARADLRLRIPQEESVESLNVAVAAGICLFEQRRQSRIGQAARS